MNHAVFYQGGIEELDLIGPLWERLNQIHYESATNFKKRYEAMSWKDRKQALMDKSKELHLEYAKDGASGQIVGYCISSVENDSHSGEVDSLFVEKLFRKTGLGEELFSRSIKWLDEQGVEVQRLSVSVGNEVVLDFYKRFGFHPLHIILQRKK